MRRREFITLLGGVTLGLPVVAWTWSLGPLKTAHSEVMDP